MRGRAGRPAIFAFFLIGTLLYSYLIQWIGNRIIRIDEVCLIWSEVNSRWLTTRP